jgi:hypothetical protein
MTNPKVKNILTIIFIMVLIGWIVYAFISRNKLEKNHNLSIATTYSCSNGGRGNAGRIFIEYRFTLDNRQYKGSTTLLTSELSFIDCKDHFIGKAFPVIYYPGNPSNSILLITPKDFKRFNYPFPDSLGWVLKYIN